MAALTRATVAEKSGCGGARLRPGSATYTRGEAACVTTRGRRAEAGSAEEGGGAYRGGVATASDLSGRGGHAFKGVWHPGRSAHGASLRSTDE
jgi:hypothetical protein